jgi:hypothetical protein
MLCHFVDIQLIFARCIVSTRSPAFFHIDIPMFHMARAPLTSVPLHPASTHEFHSASISPLARAGILSRRARVVSDLPELVSAGQGSRSARRHVPERCQRRRRRSPSSAASLEWLGSHCTPDRIQGFRRFTFARASIEYLHSIAAQCSHSRGHFFDSTLIFVFPHCRFHALVALVSVWLLVNVECGVSVCPARSRD